MDLDNYQPVICIREVNENLRRIKLEEPLTRSLIELQKNCEFKKKYNEWCNIQDGLEPDADIKKIEVKAKQRAYNQKPEVKARKRAYYQRVTKDKQNKEGLSTEVSK
jgi:hypothetical protein